MGDRLPRCPFWLLVVDAPCDVSGPFHQSRARPLVILRTVPGKRCRVHGVRRRPDSNKPRPSHTVASWCEPEAALIVLRSGMAVDLVDGTCAAAKPCRAA